MYTGKLKMHMRPLQTTFLAKKRHGSKCHPPPSLHTIKEYFTPTIRLGLTYNKTTIARRLWRNEVDHKKRERTRQQAAELKQVQKLLLIKVLAIAEFG